MDKDKHKNLASRTHMPFQPPDSPDPDPIDISALAALSGPKQEDLPDYLKMINEFFEVDPVDVEITPIAVTGISPSGSSYVLPESGSMGFSGTFELGAADFENLKEALLPVHKTIPDTRSVVLQAKRLKRIRLGIAEILATLQGGHLMCLSTEIPRTAKVVDIRYSKETNYFEMVLEDEYFDLVPEGAVISMLPGPPVAVFDLDVEPLGNSSKTTTKCEPLCPMPIDLQLDYLTSFCDTDEADRKMPSSGLGLYAAAAGREGSLGDFWVSTCGVTPSAANAGEGDAGTPMCATLAASGTMPPGVDYQRAVPCS